MSGEPVVSIVVPVWNRLDLTRQCLETIAATTPLAHEVIVVDNCSTDGTRGFLSAEDAAGRLRAILNPENRGFGKACNQGLAAARGRYVLFLNNDTIPQPGWLEALVQAVEDDPAIGMAGSRLLYPDDTIQHAGIVWNELFELEHAHRHAHRDAPEVLERCDYPAVTGACILLPRELCLDLGGFDERFHMYVEDVDLCMRVWDAGRRVTYVPESVLYHLENASVLDERWRDAHVREGWSRLFARWQGRWPLGVRRLVWPLELPGGPRQFAIAAHADELVASPALLAAYGRAFTSADEPTLVVCVPEADPAAHDRLVAAIEAAGLDRPEAPDLLAMTIPAGPGGGAVVACHVQAVYSARGPAGVFAALPHFDAAGIAELRELALAPPLAA